MKKCRTPTRRLYKGYVSEHKIMKHHMSHILHTSDIFMYIGLSRQRPFVKIVKACNKDSRGKKEML